MGIGIRDRDEREGHSRDRDIDKGIYSDDSDRETGGSGEMQSSPLVYTVRTRT